MADAIHTLKGYGKINELNIAAVSKEIRRALVQADVNYKLAKTITDEIQKEAIGQKVITSLTPQQLYTKIVYDKIVALMKSENSEISLSKNPNLIMMVGLQGSGKTTFSCKLAKFLKEKKDKNVLLVACDVYRPAAIDQLVTLGESANLTVYHEDDNKDVIKIISNALIFAEKNHINHIIIDTAGRQSIDTKMMEELKEINETFDLNEILLVLDSMIGQTAVETAKIFNDTVPMTGVVLTKLDGDANGGVALSIRSVIDVPIKFIGLGEKLDDLDVFHADRIAQRILGMGDVISFVEKAQQVYTKEQNEEIKRKIKNKEFSYVDIIKQFDMIQKIGGFKNVVDMLPLPVGNFESKFQDGEKFIKKFRYIVDSMTPEEREDDIKLTITRRSRIAKGSGTSINDVDQVVKYYETMKKSLQQLRSGKMKTMLEMLKKQNGNKK
jgi:signal recognition particle subunit SRP54